MTAKMQLNPTFTAPARASLNDFVLDAQGISTVRNYNEWPASFDTGCCPQCGGNTQTSDSRRHDQHGAAMIKRRRFCVSCGFTMTTVEVNMIAFAALVESYQSSLAIVEALRAMAEQIERARQ